MQIAKHLDLAYCTNIHPADGWEDVLRNISLYSKKLKQRLSPNRPFAVGLRLSDRESRELLDANRLAEFSEFLKESGLYVALLNGYVYGGFHRTPVKADVFAPDWQCEERVLYTLRLAEILKELLPEGVCGGISTSPISYKPWIHPNDSSVLQKASDNLARVALELIRIERESGKTISLEIEPEPDGLLENSSETAVFFQEWIFRSGADHIAAELGVSREKACRLLAEHLCICFDTCHSAIEYEEPREALHHLATAGIRVSRIQLSSALVVTLPDPDITGQLLPFDDPIYLHQVIERRNNGSLRRFRDLKDALATAHDTSPRWPREWRIHFHVPLFTPGYGTLGSTQQHIVDILSIPEGGWGAEHLEIETYTWAVLPKALKLDIVDSIDREYRWILQHIGNGPASVRGALGDA